MERKIYLKPILQKPEWIICVLLLNSYFQDFVNNRCYFLPTFHPLCAEFKATKKGVRWYDPLSYCIHSKRFIDIHKAHIAIANVLSFWPFVCVYCVLSSDDKCPMFCKMVKCSTKLVNKRNSNVDIDQIQKRTWRTFQDSGNHSNWLNSH